MLWADSHASGQGDSQSEGRVSASVAGCARSADVGSATARRPL
jgi:hypothetical protein